MTTTDDTEFIALWTAAWVFVWEGRVTGHTLRRQSKFQLPPHAAVE
jgi:hypothetical protein